MGVIRTGGGAVLVVLLTISVFAANGVVLADRTALNQDFVKSTLAEEDAYETLQETAADLVANETEDAQADLPVDIDTDRVVNETLTTEYLRSQVEQNVDRVYGYLQGERDSLYVAVNVSSVKERVGELVESRIENMSVSELLDLVADEQDLGTVTVRNVTVDLTVIGEMAESQQQYQSVRESFRNDVITQVVNEAYRTRPDDELLVLIGEDPRQYNESEQARIVREREREIKSELRAEIEGSEEVDERLASLDDAIEDRVREIVSGAVSDRFQPVVEPATQMVLTGADGLTEDMEYATFDERLSTAKSDLAENASVVVMNELDEQLEDEVVLSDGLSASAQDTLEQAKSAVGLIGLLALVLPLLSLVLIAALFLVLRSPASTAIWAGLSLGSVGIVGVLGASMVPDVVRSYVPTEDIPADIVDLVYGVIDQLAGAFGAQSFLLLVVGVVAIGGGVALRLGGAERLRSAVDARRNDSERS